MRSVRSVVTAIALGVAAASAQERKIEVSPYAGGYFSTGYQSFLGGIAPDGRSSLQEVDEPNSGILGARASYDLTNRFSLEGTFGFSPAGRSSGPLAIGGFTFASISDFLLDPLTDTFILHSSILGGDTYHYSGNVALHLHKTSGWV